MNDTDEINWAAVDIERYDWNTGALLEVYPSRRAAADWLVKEHYCEPDPTGRMARQYYCNLHTAARNERYSHGYRWRYGDPATSLGREPHTRTSSAGWNMHAIEQLDMHTGKVLRTFGSRFDAARWVGQAVDGYLDPDGSYTQSTASNLTNCIKYDHSAYGFRWRVHNPAVALERAAKLKSKPVQVFVVRTKFNKSLVFSSIAEAAERLGVRVADIRPHIGESKPPVNGLLFRWYNVEGGKKSFRTPRLAAKHFGLPVATIKKAMERGVKLNNTEVVIEKVTENTPRLKREYVKGPYRVRHGDTVQVCKSMALVAAYVGVSKQAVSGMVDTGRPIKGVYLVETVS